MSIPRLERAGEAGTARAAAEKRRRRQWPRWLPEELHSWKVLLFFGIQVALAIPVFVYEVPRLEGDAGLLAVLLALDVLADSNSIVLYGKSYTTVGIVPLIALVILFGAPGAVLAAPLEALASAYSRKRFDYRALTNGSRFILINAIVAETYASLAPVLPSTPTASMVLGAVVASAVAFVLANGFILLSTSLRTGQSLRSAWADRSWLVPHFAALTVVGIAFTSAYIALGIWGVLAFLTPALMMRLSIKQYVDKTEENVSKLEAQNQELQAANIEVRRMGEELRESYDGTLEALVNALDARDQETKGHSLRVASYMMDIARELGVREGSQEWLDMQRGALLHDVGKIGVLDSILRKPGKLDPEEWTQMRRHPEIGYQMLKQVKFLQGPAEIILAHHERWDGGGYPRGLRAEDITLGARIFPVVDTFDTITSDRPYRKAKSALEAMNEILRCSGTQFDPLVVEAFLDIYETWVRKQKELIAA